MENIIRVENNINNIKEAMETLNSHIGDEIYYSSDFTRRLAKDNAKAKEDLNNIFSNSPNFDTATNRIIIPTTYEHKPDKESIRYYFWKTLAFVTLSTEQEEAAANILKAFEGETRDLTEDYKLFEVKYNPDTKKTKMFKKLLQKEGVFENKEIQRFYANLCDSIKPRQIPFTVYISTNPGDFLTMSNAYSDDESVGLRSCHALDSTYSYKSGCTGYARDNVSFIVFTAAGTDEEIYHYKTNRQMFAYQDGVLLQSRLYTTVNVGEYGGVNGEKPEHIEIIDTFRNLVEKEITTGLNIPNLWKAPQLYIDNKWEIDIYPHPNFGGYRDWEQSSFHARLTMLQGLKNPHGFQIGESALCFSCGNTYDGTQAPDTQDAVLCDYCREDEAYCDCCNHYVNADETTEVDGQIICNSCLNEYYFFCEDCNEYHNEEESVYIEDTDSYVCTNCADRYYNRCTDCGRYFEQSLDETANGSHVCTECLENGYVFCENCEAYYPDDEAGYYPDHQMTLCDDCAEELNKQLEEAEENAPA